MAFKFLSDLAGTLLSTFRIGLNGELSSSGATAARIWTFPDKSGTVALLDDLIPVGTILPFAGAITGRFLACDSVAKSRTTYANLFKYLVTDLGFTSKTFTVTIANPAVFTMAAHGFSANGGERVRLSTTGALPTGLSTGIDYYVIYVSANTFQLSTTFGGTPVATSGTQSGTHSYLQSLYGLGDGSTTFNVPDFRAQILRGLDAGAGIDTGRTLGTRQMDMLKSHAHTTNGFVIAGASGASVGVISGSTLTDPFGGTETRGKNAAVNYGIKY
jgi:phage-related tail fiber protein